MKSVVCGFDIFPNKMSNTNSDKTYLQLGHIHITEIIVFTNWNLF